MSTTHQQTHIRARQLAAIDAYCEQRPAAELSTHSHLPWAEATRRMKSHSLLLNA
jgi:hypothetical protein